jgi:cysteinyl-tRNA synthetase
MSLALYNTLTRRVEPFEPLEPPRVTMYTCGPTVYHYAHIGNFRTFVFEDLLRRYLEWLGYEVFHIMNLTDVDDRTIAAAAKAGVPLGQHTEPFVQAFFEDRDYLRIRPAHVYPRATESIGPMVELVSRLLERGLAYRGQDGVYFAIDRFPSYGRLSQVSRRELRVGARVASDEYAKEDARDFALWKFAQPIDEQAGAAWDTPFGRGRPGWHLECSAMALQAIAPFGVATLDIHAGGVDLIFPHHENEIAQSEGATGAPFARYWLHGEHLLLQGTKMSKRYGNILTVRDLRAEQVDPAAFRLLVGSTHYRQQLNFTDEALAAAGEGVRRLGEFRERLAAVAAGDTQAGGRPPEVAVQLEAEFRQSMDDDLNVPKALGAIFAFVRSVHRELDAGRLSADQAAGALRSFDRVVGVLDVLPSAVGVEADLRAWIEERVRERELARRARDFARADAIRAELVARGVELEDTPGGTRWKKRA